MNYEIEVKKVHHDAELTGIRGLKLYIIEITNKSGYKSGLAYNTSPVATWKSAYEILKQKGKL
jgi:hypothetical protein